jgi:hypothetical protein
MKDLFAPMKILLLAAVTAIGSLVACGGGGGAADTTVQSPSLPIYVPGATLEATDSSGNTWTATYSSTAAGTSTFNGQAAYATAVFFTVQKNATLIDSESVTEFSLMNPYSPLGLAIGFSSLPGRLSVGTVTSSSPLPSTLAVGESGSLSAGTFGGCACTFTETYSVTSGSSTALLLNIHRDFPDFGVFHGEASLTGLYSGSSTMTYSIGGSGASTLVRLQVTIDGTTLNFQ